MEHRVKTILLYPVSCYQYKNLTDAHVEQLKKLFSGRVLRAEKTSFENKYYIYFEVVSLSPDETTKLITVFESMFDIGEDLIWYVVSDKGDIISNQRTNFEKS